MHTLTTGCSCTDSWQHMKWVIRVAFSHHSPPIRHTPLAGINFFILSIDDAIFTLAQYLGVLPDLP